MHRKMSRKTSKIIYHNLKDIYDVTFLAGLLVSIQSHLSINRSTHFCACPYSSNIGLSAMTITDNTTTRPVIGRFQAIKTDVLLIFSFITGD